MCIQMNVSFPIISRFLMLYSLRSGAILFMFWYLIRTVALIMFAAISIPELYTGGNASFTGYYLTDNFTNPTTMDTTYLYAAFFTFAMAETSVLVLTFHLACGLFCYHSILIKNFLTVRLYAWVIEVATSITLCFIHEILIGWYLIMLIIFILELYSYCVIKSYNYCEKVKELELQKSTCQEWAILS